jgi:DNA-binding YbaB/EbfC family protein
VSDEFDIGALLQQAQAMQQQLLEAQATAAEQEIEVEAGGGVVKIVVTGGLEFRSIRIDPKIVDPDDVEMLEDVILAALHDAVEQAQEVTQQANQQAMGGLDLGGLGLPGLPS